MWCFCNSFHFSSELIANDRISTLLSVADQNTEPRNHEDPTSSTSSKISSTFFPNADSRRLNSGAQRDVSVSFSTRMSNTYNDLLRDNGNTLSPVHQKREVFSQFIHEFIILILARDPMSSNNLVRCCNQKYQHLKVCRYIHFIDCDVCEELISALKNAIVDKQPGHKIVTRKKAQLKIVRLESPTY